MRREWEEWEEVRDYPSFLSMMDSQDWGYCDTDTSMESNTPMNNSSFFEEFAVTYREQKLAGKKLLIST